MTFVVVRPRSPALVPFVRFLGEFRGELPPGRERVMPTGDTSLMVNLAEDELRTYHGPAHATVRRTGGAAVVGPQTRQSVIDTDEQRSLVQVGFRLGGAASFFSVPLSEMRDELIDLGDLWGRDGAVLRERVLEAPTAAERLELVEAVLLERLASARECDRAVTWAVGALELGLPVARVTSRLGLPSKRFVRRFRDQVGVTPKRFARVRRLQRVLAAVARADRPEWAEVAVEHGYYDQAHLIHDFRDLAGMTPTVYRPRTAGEWNHVPLEPPEA